MEHSITATLIYIIEYIILEIITRFIILIKLIKNFNIFIMSDIDSILSERKKRKSISELEYAKQSEYQNQIDQINEIQKQNNLLDYQK
jgi:hypothetical protein